MSKFSDLMLKYRNLGKKRGPIGFVLTPDLALQMADALSKIEMGIVAVELWYPTPDQTGLIEDPYGPEFDKLLKEPDGVRKSVEAAKSYIKHDLPERIAYVSFVEDTDERYWEAWEAEKKQIAKAG